MASKRAVPPTVQPGVKLAVTGRHMEITAVLRKYVVDKTARLTRYFKNLQKVEIIFNPEKDSRFSAEMIAHAPRGSVLVCHATDQTATAALDTAIEKMERHLVKLKDRLRRRNGPSAASTPAPSRSAGDDGTGGDESADLWW